jgi:hypothetical protein
MTARKQQPLEERGLIRWQMWLGSGLIGQRAALNGQAGKVPQKGQ